MPFTPQAVQALLPQTFPPGTYHLALLNDDRAAYSSGSTAASPVINAVGHDFVAGTTVVVSGYAGAALVNGSVYHVLSPAVDELQLAATRTGSAITLDVAASFSLQDTGLDYLPYSSAEVARREVDYGGGVRNLVDLSNPAALIEQSGDSYVLRIPLAPDNSAGTALAEFDGVALIKDGDQAVGDTTGEIWYSAIVPNGPHQIAAGESASFSIVVGD